MGNFRWRLETTLNYVADQVEALGRTKDVKLLVADSGSDIPRDVLRLTPSNCAGASLQRPTAITMGRSSPILPRTLCRQG
jgi:hypothetical protein